MVERVFFCHVMKTGGTNLIWRVRESSPPGSYFPQSTDHRFVDGKLDTKHHLSVMRFLSLPEERLRAVRIFGGHYPYFASRLLEEVLGEKLATVTILRDPVERTLSLLRVYGRRGAWAGQDIPDWPMQSWPLERIYEEPAAFEPMIHNHQTKIFSMAASDPVDSSRDLIEVDRSRLAAAKQNLDDVDVLGVQERYTDLVADVEARFGWDVPSASRRNSAPDDDPREVSNSFRRRIAEDNAYDVELHEYAVQRVASRSHGRRARRRPQLRADGV